MIECSAECGGYRYGCGTWLLATVIGGVILFFWTGLTQNLIPWGTKSVKAVKEGEGIAAGQGIATVTGNGMFYITDQTAAFVVAKPASYYNTARFFGIEFVTQIIAGAVIAGILMLTGALEDGVRLLLVGLVGAASIASVDLQYWNWWGFSALYTVGVAVNRVAGYLIAAGCCWRSCCDLRTLTLTGN